ncbi:MAG: zinc-ribbon and DUF3426 domain-containing protein [Burkholderiales bacterium]
MDLYTRCSHCNTVFRVTTRDLQASSGRVRCGHCHKVFDAFASLTAQQPADSEQPLSIESIEVAELHGLAEREETAEPARPTEPSRAAATPAPEEGRKPPARTTDAPRRDIARSEDPAASLYEWEFKMAPPPRRTALWTALSLVLALGAGAQAVYAFRTEIMLEYPQTRQLYENGCEWLGCTIGLPRLAERLHIEVSDLQLVDPGRPNEVELTALIRNRAAVPIEFPSLELTLTNASEQVVGRRVFFPRNYLAGSQRIEEGLRGRDELAVRLYLDTGSVRASGYRLYLFYPS